MSHKTVFHAWNTVISIQSSEDIVGIEESLRDEINRLDLLLSHHNKDSLLYKVRENSIPSNSEVDYLLELAFNLRDITGSLYNPFYDGYLDIYSISKGYAVSSLVNILKDHSSYGGVNAGGEIEVFGEKVFNIALEDPNSTTPYKVLSLKNSAVASSGNYRKHHIKNLSPYQAASVTGKDLTLCDGLVTAFLLSGDSSIIPEGYELHFI